jgi:caffeoyl-CoA O-methyltransferase
MPLLTFLSLCFSCVVHGQSQKSKQYVRPKSFSPDASSINPLEQLLFASASFQRQPSQAHTVRKNTHMIATIESESQPKVGIKDYTGRFGGTEKTKDSGYGQLEKDSLEATSGKSATRWSIHSERVQGVAKELFGLIGGLDPYISSVSNADGPIMQAIKEKMDSTNWDALHEEGKTMFSYGPEMSTDPIEAQTIKMFTFMKNAKRVLEIGMFTGYGAAAIVEALPEDGECVSLDIDPYLKEWVGEVMSQFPDGKKHSVEVGPALDSLLKLPANKKFDFVFVDANKSEYRRYIEILLERGLLADDAMIAVDNTLYCGLPYMPEQYDAQPKRRGFGEDVKAFNEWLATQPDLMTVMLPIRDGITLVRKRL